MQSLNLSSIDFLENLIEAPDAGASVIHELCETSCTKAPHAARHTSYESRKRVTLDIDASHLKEIRSRYSGPAIARWAGKDFTFTRSDILETSASSDQDGTSDVPLARKYWLDSNSFAPLPNSPIIANRKKTDPIARIRSATVHEEIINALNVAGYRKIANRLTYLYNIIQDSDDPDDPIMSFMSLQNLALFFARDDVLLPDPDIGVDPEGLLQAEWHLSNVAALMNFLPDGKIVYAATSTVNGQGESEDNQGRGPADRALQVVRSFLVNPNGHAQN